MMYNNSKRGERIVKKKYVIELESGTHIFVFGPEGCIHVGEPDVVFETVDGMQICNVVVNVKPYTIPDINQIKEDAYLKGFNDGRSVILESTHNSKSKRQPKQVPGQMSLF